MSDQNHHSLPSPTHPPQRAHVRSDSNSELPQLTIDETRSLLNPSIEPLSYQQHYSHRISYPPYRLSVGHPYHPTTTVTATSDSLSNPQYLTNNQSDHDNTPLSHPLQSNPYPNLDDDRGADGSSFQASIVDPSQSSLLLSYPHLPFSSSGSSSPSSRISHIRSQNSFDTLLPQATSSQLPYSPASPHLPRRHLPPLPIHSPSPGQSALSSSTIIESPEMAAPPPLPEQQQQQPVDYFAGFNFNSEYSPPTLHPQHHVAYLPHEPHSMHSSIDEFNVLPSEELKHSLEDSTTFNNNKIYPKESFEPIAENLESQKSTLKKDLPRGQAGRSKLQTISSRQLVFASIVGLLLVLAAVAVIVLVHLKRATHPPETTGDSDSDVVAQSGLGSARNASSAYDGFDPFNTTTSSFAPDNGLRGGANGYDSLIVFGASYCDDAHSRPPNLRHSLKPPPYYKGRWTNGYVWNEYLSAVVGPGGRHTTLVNYAYGGATVDNILNEAPVPDLEQQVNAFLSDLSVQSPGAGPSNGKSLIAVWVGINSITKIWNAVLKQEVQARSQVEVQDTTMKAQLNINVTVDHIFDVVTNLLHTTAFKAAPPDLLLLPVPPAQLLLVNIRAAKGNMGALRTLANLNDLFNARFAEKLNSFQDSLAAGQRVFTLDIPTIWRKFIEDPTSAKLTVVDQPCLTKSGQCSSPDSYLYWDTLHPTTHIHEQLALMMSKEIQR